MSVKAVFKGLLAETEEHKQQLVEGFKEMGFHPPKVLHVFKTLPTPGEPGTGGRRGPSTRACPRWSRTPCRRRPVEEKEEGEVFLSVHALGAKRKQ